MSTNWPPSRQKARRLVLLIVLFGATVVLATWGALRLGTDHLVISLLLLFLLAVLALPAVAVILIYLVLGVLIVRSLSAWRKAPRGSVTGIRQSLLIVLGGAILVLPAIAASRFGMDPRVALVIPSFSIGLLLFVLFGLPIRAAAESKTLFPGTPEQLFQIGADIKLSLQVSGGPRKLISQTGEPGQPGSSYVTQQGRLVLTTSVVSSDPPRKLVTSTIGPGIFRRDVERTYTSVIDGTIVAATVRQRMALLTWLLQLRPAVKRAAEAEAAHANDRIRAYLRSLATDEISPRA